MKLRWWRVSLLAVAVSFSYTLANAQDRRVDLTTGNIEISLLLPAELQPFSEEKMALVRDKAKFVFSDPQVDVIAAINTFGSNANEKGLSQVADKIKADAEKQYPQRQVAPARLHNDEREEVATDVVQGWIEQRRDDQ